MNDQLKILVAQLNPTVGAIEANAAKIETIIRQHQHQHDLILFPELSLTGYPLEDLLFRPALHEKVQRALTTLAQTIHDCYVMIGHPLKDHEHYYNAVSIFYQQRCITHYDKQKLPNDGVFDEQRYFTAGPEKPCLFTIKNYQIGVCICEDIWQTGPVEQILQAKDPTKTTLLCCLNASPYDIKKYTSRLEILQKYAKQGLLMVYVNLVGGQDELIFDGQSLALDTTGTIGMRLPAFVETNSTLSIKNNQLQGEILPLLPMEASIYQALVLATRDYVHKNNFSSVLIGLSGGIDSALTLAIAVDALGAEHVHAVMMPSRYNALMSLEDAQKQVHSMQISSTILPIEPVFSEFLETLERVSVKSSLEHVMEENLQARIRGTLLMAISNKTGKLVLTTSNKSECAVGYTTLYGDMVGGFAILKDVLKTQVMALAKYRNTLSPIIPERVLTRPPSAELSEHQTDQDELPPYPLLDAMIQAYMENNQDEDALIALGFSSKIVQKIVKKIKGNEYKRRQAPPGPKISLRGFNKDWRYPITSKY